MPTWWLTDAAMFNPVCAHHVRAGRSLEAAAAGSFVASEVEEGAKARVATGFGVGLFDCVRRRDGARAEPYGSHQAPGLRAPYDARPSGAARRAWSASAR